jgi:protein SCO1/2
LNASIRVSLIIGLSFASVPFAEGSSFKKEYPAEVTAFDTEGGQGLPFLVGKDMRPVWKLTNTDQPRSLSPFEMKDQMNHAFGSSDLQGKISIVSFFFTRCSGICPMTMKNLVNVQKKFLKDDRFTMVSFSVTPDLDQPKQLRDYAKNWNVTHRRWRLITGDKSKIFALARDSFNADTFSPKENGVKTLSPADFLHSENVYLLDQNQKLRGVYNARMAGSVLELMADAEALAREN